MVKSFIASCCVAGLFAIMALPVRAVEIRGDYIESRTADIYTGPCFSNAEVFITGNQAVLAWKVREGSFKGVDLAGLTVAAAIRGTTTFSEDKPEEAKSVLIVDRRADKAQREALIELAKTLAGERLNHVVAVKSALIAMTVEEESHEGSAEQDMKAHLHATPKAPHASFWAAGLAEILTRPLDERDHFCGNETVAYQPLSRGVDVLPAYTMGASFKGEGLNVNWNDHNSRGSFVGTFAY